MRTDLLFNGYKKTGGERVKGKIDRMFVNRVTGRTERKAPTYAKLTLPSCRRYFNTHAEETMSKSRVES
jgi:hypothetical protein